jgi:hypothetical protein
MVSLGQTFRDNINQHDNDDLHLRDWPSKLIPVYFNYKKREPY